ncbi:hypothetical protein BDW62DRAFT_204089 [Aspergillus aurantiobrunneus]
MPMNWTSEANAKLFLGVLEQLKEQNVKLNYSKLAEYMGPEHAQLTRLGLDGAECSHRAIDNQIIKLKKQAAGGSASDSQSASAPATPATPAGTPKKRRAPAGSKASTPDKRKKAVEDDADEDEKRLLKEVREELKNL